MLIIKLIICLKLRKEKNVSKLLYYIQLLGKYYSSIATQCKSANIYYNEKNVDILEKLKINGIIFSYKKDKNNNVLVFNKRWCIKHEKRKLLLKWKVNNLQQQKYYLDKF